MPALISFLNQGLILPFCPERAGELPVPRPPCEIVGERVFTKEGRDCTPQSPRQSRIRARFFTKEGRDCTAAFRLGAERALAEARKHGIQTAILKEGSPSCGVKRVYDGSFSGRARPGQGFAAALPAEAGIHVYSDEDEPAFFPPEKELLK